MATWAVLRSLASQIKAGTDLTRVCIPCYFSSPESMLVVIANRRMQGMQILSRASNVSHPYARILYVLQWYLRGVAAAEFNGKKPLNPVLGETYQCVSEDGVWFLAEQVSHHPPISAYHFEDVENGKFSYVGEAQVSAAFWGNSVTVESGGYARLSLRLPSRGEEQLEKKGRKCRGTIEDDKNKKTRYSRGDSSKCSEDKHVTEEGPEEGREDVRKGGDKKMMKKKKKTATYPMRAKKIKEDEEVVTAKRKYDPTSLGPTEEYTFTPQFPTMEVSNILIGRRRNSRVGQVTIACEKTGYSARLLFEAKHSTGVLSSVRDWVHVDVLQGEAVVCSLAGQWVEHVSLIDTLGDVPADTLDDFSQLFTLKGTESVLFEMDELSTPLPEMVVQDWQAGRDSSTIWSSVIKYLENEEFDAADVAKVAVERHERERQNERERVEEPFQCARFIKNERGDHELISRFDHDVGDFKISAYSS